MPATDLPLLIAAARKSGEIAKGFFKSDPQVWHKADEAGPVTEADLAVNVMLQDQLRGARPDYGWLSEESEDNAARLSTKRQFVIDPIDGTRSFIEGSPDWAHSLAVVENGQVTAAAVFLPVHDFLFTATRDGGAFLNDAAVTVSEPRGFDDATILSAKPNFDARFWHDGTPPPIKRAFRSSLAYRLCLVAQGRFDAMLTLRPTWEWDIAAGALIVAEAGGHATDHIRAQLKFNNPHPQVPGVLAAGPDLHRRLGQRINPQPMLEQTAAKP